MKNAPKGLIAKPKSPLSEMVGKIIVAVPPSSFIQSAFLILLLFVHIWFSGTLTAYHLSVSALDQYARLAPKLELHPALTYIGIDSKTVLAFQESQKPRSAYAEITKLLREWGAKAIVFNFYFQKSTALEEDQILIDEFSKTDNLYLPMTYQFASPGQYYLLKSDEVFGEHAKLGHAIYGDDLDHVLRKLPPFVKYQKELVPHLAIQVAMDYEGKPIPDVSSLPFPTDSQKVFWIHWGEQWKEGQNYFSLMDVLKSAKNGNTSSIKPEHFKDKICLIGVTAAGTKDFFKTPFNDQSPSIEILGSAINTLLTKKFLRPVSPNLNIFILVAILFLSFFILVPYRKVSSFFSAVGLMGLWLLISFGLYTSTGLLLNIPIPLIFILSLTLFSMLYSIMLNYREEQKLLRLSQRDELTGLLVMKHFQAYLDKAVRDSHAFRRPFSIVLMDLDDLRKVNEEKGKHEGDEILKQTAQVIQSCLKSDKRPVPDVAARFGTEEFIVLLPGTNAAMASFGIAERIRKQVRQKTNITISLGVASFEKNDTTAEQVIEKAQGALMKAKSSGKNQVCLA